MKKRLASGVTFDASAKTVTHANFSDIGLAGIQLIVNVTDQVIIYNFSDTTKGGTLSTDTLTLEFDTTSMDDADELMVLVEDGVATQGVTGTVTAELSATDNAVLDAIAASLDTIDSVDFATQTTLAAIKAKTDNIPAQGQALAAASVPVVLTAAQVTALTPPAAITGFATSAKQDTIIGHVDGVETLLGTIDADTSNISTKIDTLAGAVAGSEMQVDVLTMPTVTVNSHAVTNAGTFPVQVDGAALTSLQLADDVVKTLGTDTYTEASTKGTLIGAVRRDANTSLVDTTNEVAPLQVNATGELKVAQIQPLPAGTNAIGKLSANSGVDIGDVDITSIAAGDNNIGNVDIVTVPSDPFGANADAASATGSISAKLRGIATALGITALDLGTGTGGSRTLRIFQDTAQFVGGTGTDSSATQRVSLATNIALPAGTNLIGKVGIDQTTPGTTNAVQDIPATSGGLSKFHLVGAATDNATNVKASAGQVYSITAFNLNASPRYLKFHNTAGTPTAGSGVTDTFLIPGNTSGAGLVLNVDKGIAFGTGIGISIVTGIADNNTTAIGASEVVVNIYYK